MNTNKDFKNSIWEDLSPEEEQDYLDWLKAFNGEFEKTTSLHEGSYHTEDCNDSPCGCDPPPCDPDGEEIGTLVSLQIIADEDDVSTDFEIRRHDTQFGITVSIV